MCLSALLTAGLGLAGDIFSGLTQKKGADKAAAAQVQTAQAALGLQQGALDKGLGIQQAGLDRALGLQQGGLDRALGLQKQNANLQRSTFTNGQKVAGGYYTQARQGMLPWLNAGKSALAQLQRENGLAPGGSNFTASPGYQFRFNEGLRGVQNSFAALGMKNSGAALKGIDRFSQGIASDEYGNYYNRLAGLANSGQQAAGDLANLGQNMSNQTTQAYANYGNALGGTYDKMANLVGNTANNQSGLVSNYANNTTSLIGNAATNMGNILQDMGAYRASGYAGGANALSGMINAGTNTLGNYLGYKQYPLGGGLY